MNRRWMPMAVVLVCAAFALRSLGLIDATSLWADELYSVGKSFQPSYGDLLAQLRQDTNPPLYYTLFWVWGGVVGQSGLSLRLLSWLAYGIGGLLMAAQAKALAPAPQQRSALLLAALMAFCSPYPLRFSLEGKSYALLTALVALAWWWRRRRQPALYGLSVLLASLTHFYGLFLFAATACWDAAQRRGSLATATSLALLPSLAWIAYAWDYLFSSSAAAWIGRPDFALLEDTLARALGPWPLPKLGLILMVLWALRRWGLAAADEAQQPIPRGWLLDWSGVIPSALMVIGVVAVSFVKPLAFSRYFVVLVPAFLPWLAVQGSGLSLNVLGRRLSLIALLVALGLFWWQGFQPLQARGLDASREADNFRAVSQATAGQLFRFAPRPRLFTLSDRMELAAGRLTAMGVPWGDEDDLEQLFQDSLGPEETLLAASGPDPVMRRRVRPLQTLAESSGYRCEIKAEMPPMTHVLVCRTAR